MLPKNHVTYSPHLHLTLEIEQNPPSGLASHGLFFQSLLKWQIWQDLVDRSTTIHIEAALTELGELPKIKTNLGSTKLEGVLLRETCG